MTVDKLLRSYQGPSPYSISPHSKTDHAEAELLIGLSLEIDF